MNFPKSSLLIIEDDLTQRKAILPLVEKFGFTATLVDSYAEALDVLSRAGNVHDAIVVDWKLSGNDAITFIKKVRQHESGRNKRIPLIAMMSDVSDDYRQRCLQSGVDDCLGKPFDSETFRRVLLRWAYNPGRPNLRILPGVRGETA